MTMRTLLVTLLCSSAAASLPAQQIWKVHNGSLPGAHFTDLPQAVAAAAPNDTIYVYLGGTSGAEFTAATIDKPLTIVGFQVSPQGPSGSEPPPALFRGLFTITGIPAGQRVVLATCFLDQDTSTYPVNPTGLHIVNCAGEVVIEDLWFRSGGMLNTLFRIENSPNVVLRGCDFTLGGSPIELIDSTVLVASTIVDHRYPIMYPVWFPGIPFFTQTCEGIRVTNSALTIVDSAIRGSFAISGYGPGYDARKGVHVVSGTVVAGPGASVRGGALLSVGETSGYSIVDPLTGFFHQDDRAYVPHPWPAVAPLPATLHTMITGWPIAGDVAWFDVWGPPGGFALVAFGDRLAAPAATSFGALSLDPNAWHTVDLVALTAPDGSHSWSPQLPLTAPVGHPFALQALTLAPTGEIGLCTASPFTVLYPYWIAP